MGSVEKETNGGNPPAAPPAEDVPKLEDIITPELLQAVAKGYNPDTKLVSHKAELGTKVGDNYMSIMYAVDLELEDTKTKKKETLKTMVKTIPRHVQRAEMVNDMKAFTKEAEFYGRIFPEFTQFQKEKGIPAELRFAQWPKHYAAHVDGTTDFLAMENLKIAGYKMGNRQTGLDYHHSVISIRNMAKYHAISYAKFGGCRETIIKAYPDVGGWMFSENEKTADMQQQFFTGTFKSLKKSLRDGGEELAASRLEKMESGNVMGALEKLLLHDIEVAVVTHGDCWVNNMLFKYDDADKECRIPVNFKFLDFQISSATSRIVDLSYFMMTSVKVDVLKKYEEELLMTYYTEFTSFAQMFGVDTKAKGLTWDAFLSESYKYRFYGVCLGLLLAPMFAAEASDIPDFDSFTEEDFSDKNDAAMETFLKDMLKGPALVKAKYLALEQLPKCTNFERFL